jgi:hypothetical protein
MRVALRHFYSIGEAIFIDCRAQLSIACYKSPPAALSHALPASVRAVPRSLWK